MQKSEDLLAYHRGIRFNFHRWRYRLGILQKVSLSLGMAVITGISAQIRIPLPYTPVPITGQVLAVLLSGVLLGRWYGSLSQLFYVSFGGIGLPWFAGMSGGISVLAGPTGGYLLGFILASGVIGWFTQNYVRMRRFLPLVGINLMAIGLIYFAGSLQLSIELGTGFLKTLQLAVIPFIWGDLIKAIFVTMIGTGITPKQAYNGEFDA